VIGDIIDLAFYYSSAGADELVFYDITASPSNRQVDYKWVSKVAKYINIPFCVAGGIRTIESAELILNSGADKISINTPAIESPDLIEKLAHRFGSQCVVVGMDSKKIDNKWIIYKNTGDPNKASKTVLYTLDWIKEVQLRGAGEIVLNCISSDGTRNGYDTEQLHAARIISQVPLIASGGAGHSDHFVDLFNQIDVDGALAATVFHTKQVKIDELKIYLKSKNINVRV
jgi:imidazole glycerol-phosphate synthase subunit HisF